MAAANPLPASLTAPPQVVREATEHARKATDALRTEIRRQCWNQVSSDDAPSEVPLHLSLSFGEDGNVRASGVSEDREAYVEGLANCVHPLVRTIEIPPPEAPVPVQFSITVP